MNLNFGLSKNEFDELVTDLRNGDERLFEIMFRHLIKKGIERLRSKYKNDDIAIEDAVMDTLLVFRERLLKGKINYGALVPLFYKLLFQKYSSIRKHEITFVYGGGVTDMEAIGNYEEPVFDTDKIHLLDEALKKMDKKCVEILKALYLNSNNTKNSIALASKHLNLTESGVSKRKNRCLNKLRLILKQNEEFK